MQDQDDASVMQSLKL
jgi:hypothetical protein